MGEKRRGKLVYPPMEMKYIYDNTIRNWFQDEVKKKDLSILYTAILQGDAETFQKELTAALQSSISYLDIREAFYYGFVIGILENLDDYLVRSNRETGSGRSDPVIRSLDVNHTLVVLELKASDTFKGMSEACDRALQQQIEENYDNWLPEEGHTNVWSCGIVFKQCRMKVRFKRF